MGPVDQLTSAQILFVGLAAMEDAQIKAGNGTVKRDGTASGGSMDADIAYSANYGKMKRELRQGGAIQKEMEERKKKQAPFRAALEAEIKKVLQEEERYS